MRVGDRLWRGADAVAVTADVSLAAAQRLMQARRVEHLAVLEGDRLAGVLARDDLEAAWPSPATTLARGEVLGALDRLPVGEVVRRGALVVAPETPLAEAARLMRDTGARALPVVRNGRLEGLLTVFDLLELHAAVINP
jgi:acetoin utilization protein AcuB